LKQHLTVTAPIESVVEADRPPGSRLVRVCLEQSFAGPSEPTWDCRGLLFHRIFSGRPVPIFRANYNFRAVPVPAGEHLITFSYRPRSLYYGTIVSAGGLMMLAGLLGKWQFDHFQKRRSTTVHPKEQKLL